MWPDLCACEAAMQAYGDGNNCLISKHRTDLKKSYYTFVCNAFGQSRGKAASQGPLGGQAANDYNQPQQHATTTTMEVRKGCMWQVKVHTKKATATEHSHLYVYQSNCVHGGRCERTPANLLTRKKQQGQLSVMTPGLCVKFKELMDAGAPIVGLREFLRKHFPDAPLTAADIANIRATVRHRHLNNLLNSTFDPTSTDPDVQASAIEQEINLVVTQCVREGIWPLRMVLEYYQQRLAGFKFRIWEDDNGQPLGAVWMTARMQALALLFGDVMFLDAKTTGSNTLRWPFWCPSVMDHEFHVRSIAYAITCTESNETGTRLLQKICEMVPGLSGKVGVVFTDGLLSSESILVHFPNAVHFRCVWHFMEIDLVRQLGKIPRFNQLKANLYDRLVLSATPEAFYEGWATIQEDFKDQPGAVEYLQTWVDCAHQWAGWSRKLHFTLGRMGNTMAEVANAVIGRWMLNNVHPPHNLLIETMRRCIWMHVVYTYVCVARWCTRPCERVIANVPHVFSTN